MAYVCSFGGVDASLSFDLPSHQARSSKVSDDDGSYGDEFVVVRLMIIVMVMMMKVVMMMVYSI